MIPIPLILGWNTVILNLINLLNFWTTYWKFNKLELEKINTKIEVVLKQETSPQFSTFLCYSTDSTMAAAACFRPPLPKSFSLAIPGVWYLDSTSFNVKFEQVQIQGHAESEISREERYYRKHNSRQKLNNAWKPIGFGPTYLSDLHESSLGFCLRACCSRSTWDRWRCHLSVARPGKSSSSQVESSSVKWTFVRGENIMPS